jgi:hypothetical protein
MTQEEVINILRDRNFILHEKCEALQNEAAFYKTQSKMLLDKIDNILKLERLQYVLKGEQDDC